MRTNGVGNYTNLTPRQALTPTPYAITAANVVSGGLATGRISLDGSLGISRRPPYRHSRGDESYKIPTYSLPGHNRRSVSHLRQGAATSLAAAL